MLLPEERSRRTRQQFCRWIYLPLSLLLLVPSVRLHAQQVLAKARKTASPSPAGAAPKPELLNADSDPTLHYPVGVWESSSTSCGWLDITRGSLRYSAAESSGQSKSRGAKKFATPAGVQYFAQGAAATTSGDFEVNKPDLTYVGLVKNFLRLGIAKRSILVFYLPQYSCESFGGSSRALLAAAQRDPSPAGTAAIMNAIRNFDRTLSEVQGPREAPSMDVSLRVEPASVEKGRPVTLIWNSTNATSLDLEPGIGRVAASGGITVAPQDSTNYTLTASGAAGTKTAAAYVTVTQPAPPAVPTLVLIEPSAAEGQTVEIAHSPVTVRGVVMDALGIPVVTVNGVAVSMRPTSAQAAQFTSDPVTLQPGENRVDVVATNNAHGQAKVSFVVHFATSSPPARPAPTANSKGLSKAEILSLLQGDVPCARVADLVKERGVKFAPTPDDLKDIRAAGGGDDLVDAITQATGH